VETNKMKKFPRVQNTINNGTFKSDHYAANLLLSNPIIPAIEYFLSLEQIRVFTSKYNDLVKSPAGYLNRRKNMILAAPAVTYPIELSEDYL
jgi:hypothetical protein